jgi:hypothetical protein
MKSQMTLRDAIQIFHGDNSLNFSDRDMSNEAQIFFKCHDIAHVIFGCDTSIVGEGKVKIWTVFGTTLGFWNLVKGYSEANAFTLFKQYSVYHVLSNILKIVCLAPITIFRARCMSKKWDWSEYETYMDMSLVQIRKEFNIKEL